jgi:hypothetical protein
LTLLNKRAAYGDPYAVHELETPAQVAKPKSGPNPRAAKPKVKKPTKTPKKPPQDPKKKPTIPKPTPKPKPKPTPKPTPKVSPSKSLPVSSTKSRTWKVVRPTKAINTCHLPNFECESEYHVAFTADQEAGSLRKRDGGKPRSVSFTFKGTIINYNTLPYPFPRTLWEGKGNSKGLPKTIFGYSSTDMDDFKVKKTTAFPQTKGKDDYTNLVTEHIAEVWKLSQLLWELC